MNESALTRAQRAIELTSRARSDTLDLHGLGLKTLPPLTVGLRNLRRLDLSGNRLRTLPTELWQLAYLENLDLSGNRIGVLDAGIGSLHALRSLDLSENRLNDLPHELAACTSLERLSLFGNLFWTLPEAVRALSGLRRLDLASNRLERLPDLSRLINLEVLDLASNLLSIPPAGLVRLKELRTLDLSYNRLTSLDELVLPRSIDELYLDDNLLTEIPGRLGAIGRLSALANPIAPPHPSADRSAAASRAGSLRELVTGGYEDDKRYFEAPDHQFRFVLDLPSKPAIDSSLNLYFKAFTGTPVSMRLRDGSHVNLTRIGRQAARAIAAASGSVLLVFPPTSETAIVEATCEFAERTLDRAPGSVLVELSGTERGGRAGATVESLEKTEPPEATSREAMVAATPNQTAGAVPLPAPVPGGTGGSVTRGSSAAGGEPVDTAVFCPPQVARDSVFLVQVYLYSPDAATEVDAQARQADEASERRGTYSLPLDLLPGTRVDLHLEIPSLTVSEPDAVVIWRVRTTAAQFEVVVPADVAGAQVIGRVRIAVAGVPAGTLRFQVALAPAGTSPGAADARELRARRYRRAFVSYSSNDRAEVLRRVQAFRIAGLSVFQDILDLDPGERWEKALYREIDHCDVFLLFWSHAAADSRWVGKEIEYAVACKQGDEEHPPDIQPVPIEGPPIVPPPASLKGLHFNDALLAQIHAAKTTAVPQSTTGDTGV